MNRADRRKFLKSERIYKETIKRDAKLVNCYCGKVTFYHRLLKKGAFNEDYCSLSCSEAVVV